MTQRRSGESTLHNRRSFTNFATLIVAVISGSLMLAMFGEYGGVVWWAWIVAIAYGAGRLWAHVAWPIYKTQHGIVEPGDNGPK